MSGQGILAPSPLLQSCYAMLLQPSFRRLRSENSRDFHRALHNDLVPVAYSRVVVQERRRSSCFTHGLSQRFAEEIVFLEQIVFSVAV